MNWTDSREIAQALLAAHPEVEPLEVRFTDLHAWVIALPGFDGKPDGSNEKALEAIQMLWLEERED